MHFHPEAWWGKDLFAQSSGYCVAVWLSSYFLAKCELEEIQLLRAALKTQQLTSSGTAESPSCFKSLISRRALTQRVCLMRSGPPRRIFLKTKLILDLSVQKNPFTFVKYCNLTTGLKFNIFTIPPTHSKIGDSIGGVHQKLGILGTAS